MGVVIVKGIALPSHDKHFADHIERGPVHNNRGTYQFEKFTRILPYVDKSGIALDIGAHVGLWSIQLAAVFHRVIAFEPILSLADCFALNTAHLDNVRLCQKAVGAYSEFGVEMSYSLMNTGNSHIAEASSDCPVTRVPMTCIDDIRFHGRTRERGIAFIKIDVEGYEASVIEGARETIERYRPVVLIEQKPGNAERYGRTQYDARDMLLEMGMVERWSISGDHLMDWKDR